MCNPSYNSAMQKKSEPEDEQSWCKLSAPYKEIMHITPRHSYKEIKYTIALKA